MGHKDIVEAAVVSVAEVLKGEIPIGFVIIKQGHKPDPMVLEKELIKKVREDIGPVAAF